MVAELAEHLRFLNRERGTAVLLVEQEVTLAFGVCPRALVLEAGRIIAAGPSAELAQSETVRKAYFGDLGVAEAMTGPTVQTTTEVST